jgi:hypothetical protein
MKQTSNDEISNSIINENVSISMLLTSKQTILMCKWY